MASAVRKETTPGCCQGGAGPGAATTGDGVTEGKQFTGGKIDFHSWSQRLLSQVDWIHRFGPEVEQDRLLTS